MLQVIDLHRPGLEPTSFSVSPGECVAVSGPSGAGKTLLLRALADLDPSEGCVTLHGRDRTAIPAPEWRRQVVYVPAEPGWWAQGVGEHFPDWAAASPLLLQVGLPHDAKDWPIKRCSTGERLRLALVRALVAAPCVMLLDEPTAALDAATEAAVETLMRERLRQGLAALWVTHDETQARRVAHRALLVEAGRVRAADNP